MNDIADVITVYRKIAKASKAGKGISLSWAEVAAITCDGAVMQAIDQADAEEQDAKTIGDD